MTLQVPPFYAYFSFLVSENALHPLQRPDVFQFCHCLPPKEGGYAVVLNITYSEDRRQYTVQVNVMCGGQFTLYGWWYGVSLVVRFRARCPSERDTNSSSSSVCSRSLASCRDSLRLEITSINDQLVSSPNYAMSRSRVSPATECCGRIRHQALQVVLGALQYATLLGKSCHYKAA